MLKEFPLILDEDSMSLQLSLEVGFDVVRGGVAENVAYWTRGAIIQSDPSYR